VGSVARPPGRALVPALATLYAAFAIYGSLVPFDFHPRPLAEAWAEFLALRLAPVGIQSRADWAANVLLFVPLAFLWCAALWPRRRWVRATVALGVWAAAVLLSAAIEFAQSFFPSRSVSLNDIVAEGLGAALGVAAYAFTGARIAVWLGAWWTAGTVSGLAGPAVVLYLAGLVFFGLMPFDLSLSPALVYEKLATGLVRMGPVPRFHGSVAETLTDVLTDVAVWVPAGFLGRLAVPPSLAGRSARAPAALAWIGCVAVAAGIEALQLLVASRVVDVSDVTLAAVGAGLGVRLAGRLLRRWPAAGAAGTGPGVAAGGGPRVPAAAEAGPAAVSVERQTPARPALIGAVAFVLWLAVVVAVLWQPFDFTADRAFLYERAQHLSLVPFRAYYFSTELRAATKIFLPSRTFDLGNVLLEAAAATVGYWLAVTVPGHLGRRSSRPAGRRA
jgi:VanZ family protein